ncbi:MAG: hypothetical protein WDO24_11865 [Pseudomonadota bacterium]
MLAVLTAAEIVAPGSAMSRGPLPLTDRHGAPIWVPHRPVLADTRVLHVGQPVALVVAENLAAAQDAAELVAIDYDPLPAVTDLRAAIAPGAPLLWPEAPGNIAIDWPGPVPDSPARMRAVEQVLAGAPHVAARHPGQSAHRRLVDGAARRDRLVRTRRQTATACAAARRACR